MTLDLSHDLTVNGSAGCSIDFTLQRPVAETPDDRLRRAGREGEERSERLFKGRKIEHGSCNMPRQRFTNGKFQVLRNAPLRHLDQFSTLILCPQFLQTRFLWQSGWQRKEENTEDSLYRVMLSDAILCARRK